MPPNGDPLGPVVIGPREIYDAVVRVGNAVERLTDQHEATAADVASHETQLRVLSPVPSQVVDHEARLRAIEATQPKERFADHAGRITSLESGRWPLPSLAALLGLAGLLLSLLTYVRR